MFYFKIHTIQHLRTKLYALKYFIKKKSACATLDGGVVHHFNVV